MNRIAFLLLFLLFVSIAPAQVTTGTLLGDVTDASGAAISGAKVVVLNTETNVSSEFVTNASGEYVVPYLQPGEYQVTIEAPGFKKYRQTSIALGMDSKARIDAKLQVGNVSESVNVVATTERIQTDSADLSQTMTEYEVESLPNVGRNLLNFMALAPGIVPSGGGSRYENPDMVGYNNRNESSQFSVNGSKQSSTEFQLDGAPNTDTRNNEVAVLPNLDAIQEVKLITNNYSAEFGRAGGGIMMWGTKSGTNRLHGAIFENLRNNALNANTYGNNQFGRNPDGSPVRPKPKFNVNQFGGSVGGPIWIPKVYNGRNRTFFFVAYEGLRRADGGSSYATVPTALERIGDFSQTFAQVRAPDGSLQFVQRQVYLPFPSTTTVTTVSAGQYRLNRERAVDGGIVNKIPRQYLNPIALKALSFYPLPNITPLNEDGTSNYFQSASSYGRTDQVIAKFDQNFSSAHKSFFRMSVDQATTTPPNLFKDTNPGATANWPTDQFIPTMALGHTWIISSRSLLDVRANLTRINWNTGPASRSEKLDLEALGFSKQMISTAPVPVFPAFRSLPYANIGGAGSVIGHSTYPSVNGTFTRILNQWTLKAGGEYRVMLNNYYQPTYTSMAFKAVSMTQGCSGTGCPTKAWDDSEGYGGADFLVGAIDGQGAGGLYISGDPALALKYTYLAGFMQSDWKPKRNLTLNIGVRWDYQGSAAERYDRLSQFDPKSNNATGTPGLFMFSGRNGVGRGQMDPDYRDFAPRIGIAYRVTGKTVVRSGYAISYDMITGVQTATASFGADTFVYPSFMQIRPDSGLDIVNQPFQDSFRAGGMVTGTDPMNPAYLGRAVSAHFRSDFRAPYMQQWNFTIEREIARRTLMTVAYVGSKGTRLMVRYNPIDGNNSIPQPILQAARKGFYQTGADPLAQRVTNPFYGIIDANATMSAATITQQTLVRAFPAYASVNANFHRFGSSSYNSFQTTFRRAFSAGTQLNLSYTWSKNIDFANGTNSASGVGGTDSNFVLDNLKLERSVSYNDVPHRVVASYVVQLPFGRGHTLFQKTPVVSRVLSGWRASGSTIISTGIPLAVTGGGGFGRPDLVSDPVLPKKYQVIGDGHTAYPLPDGSTIVVPNRRLLYFNPHAFRSKVVTTPVAGNPTQTQYAVDLYWYGNSPRNLPHLRQPGINVWNMSLSRTFRLTEKARLEFRCDAQNALNHNIFLRPVVAFGSSYLGKGALSTDFVGTSTAANFGTIDTTADPLRPPRYLQVSVRIAW